MKVLIWATTFGADLWSLTRHLDQLDDVKVKVVMKDPKLFLQEGVNQLYPLRAELVERTARVRARGVPDFQPDVTVFDNEVPPPGKSRTGFALWHGYGWKGPNDVKEMRSLYLQIRLAWGNPRKPSARFRWQCFGPKDFEHRTQTSGLHPTNCLQLGSTSHDDLRRPIDKSALQPFYPFDVVTRKTVLLAPTWHYGEVFSHWGGDALVLTRVLDTLREQQTNVILRLHDSFRFDAHYTAFLNDLAARYPNVLLKFKDKNPDNLLDMQVSDVLVTNFSSIANLFYATGRPTIHVYPVKSADEEFIWRKRTLLGIMKKRLAKASYIWKFPPEDNGGMLARDAEELLSQLELALGSPQCCKDRSQEFLHREMLGADGRNCERVVDELRRLVSS